MSQVFASLPREGEAILRRLSDPADPPTSVTIPSRLVVRSSSASAPPKGANNETPSLRPEKTCRRVSVRPGTSFLQGEREERAAVPVSPSRERGTSDRVEGHAARLSPSRVSGHLTAATQGTRWGEDRGLSWNRRPSSRETDLLPGSIEQYIDDDVPTCQPRWTIDQIRATLTGRTFASVDEVAVLTDDGIPRLVGLIPIGTVLAAAPSLTAAYVMDSDPL